MSPVQGALARGLVTLILAVLPALCGAAGGAEDLYLNGVLPSGAPLVAERDGGVRIEGKSAACVNCHRRSGLGMIEGRTRIPPVAGSYLFHPRAGASEDLDLPFVETMRRDRDPYTDATLARAVREGVAADGSPLSPLMPHYALDSEGMAKLIAYLKQLSPAAVPGVNDSVLHFATIVTPEADPATRRGILDVLDKFFADKNHYTRAESPRLRSSYRMAFKVNRHWQLHVWELTGEPSTWQRQLKEKLAREPVFAVLSGVGGHTWAPIHNFCEEESIPCLFPNVDVPVVAEDDFDSLYLSKGVLLEAGLIAHAIEALPARSAKRRIVQVFRSSDAGVEAAKALAGAMKDDAAEVVDREVSANADARDVAAAIRTAGRNDVLVLWLRAADVAALDNAPPKVATVFLSGRMGGLEETPLPSAWRKVSHLAYPFDLPEGRRVRVDFPLGWFRIRQIPVVAIQAQVDTYIACNIVSDAINHMADTFVRDYLVERIEGMLEHRIMNGYYPRLALAPGQRFASKGGYVVHFAAQSGAGVVPEGDWTVP